MFSTKCAIMSINKKDIIHFMPLQMVHSLELDVEGKLEFALSTFVQFLIILSVDSLLCYKQPVTNCRLVCSYIFLHYIFHSTCYMYKYMYYLCFLCIFSCQIQISLEIVPVK